MKFNKTKTTIANLLGLVVLIFLFVQTTPVQADPAITGTNSTSVQHKQTLTVTGSDFGTKDPAAPLMWDDCEEEIVDTAPDSIANSYSQVGYIYTEPDPADVGDAWEIRYREIPYTPVTDAIGPPHSHSMKYLSGGHEDTGDFSDGVGVSLTVATPSSFENRWYTHFYYRLNDDWPSCGSGSNHKFLVYQAGTRPYSNSPYYNEYIYADYSSHPCNDFGYVEQKVMPLGPLMTSEGVTNAPDTIPPWDYLISGNTINSPRDGWVSVESIVSNDIGYWHIYHNNVLAWGGTNVLDWFTGTCDYCLNYSGIRSMTIGGYYRYTDTPTNTAHDDAFRFFDDIYIDSTLSRVMLANNQDYESATIIEPQIPSAWSDNSITVTTNIGALTGDTAYLFVFDADNNHNPMGYTVTLSSGSDTTPPVISNGSPAGSLPQGTTQTAISVNTNENANCRYSTEAGVSYASMPNTFSETDSTTHSATVSDLQDGQTYNYHVRCQDPSGNFNTDDFAITFSISNDADEPDADTGSGGGNDIGCSCNQRGFTLTLPCILLVLFGLDFATRRRRRNE
ncbi:MAG: hypothetical protein SVR08_14950 [Spirochaetota bacterium]|nr:hypothetical protein [Spirochaetota bacterium]